MKKYLITGSSGFVSRHFLEFLESNKINAMVKLPKIIIGSNEKISTNHGWERRYTIERSLNDIINYWKS